MITKEIQKELFRLQDKKYREFQCKLIPTVAPDSVIGVRTPELRRFAKELMKDAPSGGPASEFLDALPHRFFEENQLHGFMISGIRDFNECIRQVERFLPFVDNWATCDQMSPKVFAKYRAELLRHIQVWLRSDKTYTVRFGIKMLMDHYLDGVFDIAYPEMVANSQNTDYYVNMMRAWYFATALAKQYDAALPFLEEHRLDKWTHNKTIQKAIESYRITGEQKTYLRTLRRK